uniref:Histone-lysine N-methyltransferase EZ1 isoform X2 n=1 Tax=Elaeis guineensis var. tenera TaxID=51953 RepID=A0A6J0PRA5_ELAGV|nr:histone-lysine N-methyltransferase EZ1 isoform X2 [Elaeis guineensis]
MVSSSRAADSSSGRSKRSDGEQGKQGISSLSSKLSQLKKQIQEARLVSIGAKLRENMENLKGHTLGLFDSAAAAEAATRSSSARPVPENMLSVRMGSPLCRLIGSDVSNGVVEREYLHVQEENLPSGTVLFGSNGNSKAAVRLVKLPFVNKIPPYTAWIFLDKNQRMADDQSVVGRRRIYYDPYGSEALICSESDEEIADSEEEKHEFSEGEDQILWKAIQEHGLHQDVLNILVLFIDATHSEIKERYETLMEKHEKHGKNSEVSDKTEPEERLFLNKTLNAALDSFDNLFCRRCLIFDCRLHGCSQNLIIPSEKLSNGFELEENRKPCGDQCYLKRRDVRDPCNEDSHMGAVQEVESKTLTEKVGASLPSESEDSNPDDDNANATVAEQVCDDVDRPVPVSSEAGTSGMPNLGATNDLDITTSEVSMKNLGKRKANDHLLDSHPISIADTQCPDSEASTADQLQKKATEESTENSSRTDTCVGNGSNTLEDVTNNTTKVSLLKSAISSSKEQTAHGWNTIEKDLYLKGIEIFGKNSCLIARNLLCGMKTCLEVSNYMFHDGAAIPSRPVLTDSFLEDSGKADQDYMEQDVPTRTRIWRKRGRARKLKYTWKSAGHPSIRKRIGDGQLACKQFTPCGCQQMCGKQCPCMDNGTCCEKYCGCSKSCKNRFRGCHCAKSQCRSRQCPCFAAGRECDPDVCRNCWVSCGDGSLGEPPARGDGYQCGNMKLLLKQQQRILLGRSDVAGWGAFIKNPVNKNDYLGEYTGELISHKEADKRGKIYDRANSSFLFDLNDQYVLDAYRKGDKLKFANHSSNPNCYAKIMLVAGDHRVGIFAKEHVEAGEELFYDYRYGPDQAPAWARKLDGSKRDDSLVSHSRAHKVA